VAWAWAIGAAFVLFLPAGCVGSSTPDTEDQTLAQARQTLRDAGVPEENISVTDERGDPNSLIVCDQGPDGVAPTRPVTLDVATECPDDDDGPDRKKRRRISGGSGGRR